MPQDRETRRDEVQYAVIDAMLYNGVDSLAPRRAHMRELTAARQAAEQLQSRQANATTYNLAPPQGAARLRTVAMYAELARLNAEHQAWQLEQGEAIQERPKRRRKARPSLES